MTAAELRACAMVCAADSFFLADKLNALAADVAAGRVSLEPSTTLPTTSFPRPAVLAECAGCNGTPCPGICPWSRPPVKAVGPKLSPSRLGHGV